VCAWAAAAKEDEKAAAAGTKEEGQFEGQRLSWKEEDGLEIKIIRPIKAEKCKLRSRPGDIVDQYYKLDDKDGKEIGSNFGGKVYKFTLGKSQVIKGMDRAMTGMCVGEKRKVVIPGKLGFGKDGRDRDQIAVDQTLYYTVQLVDLFRPVPGEEWTADGGLKIKVTHKVEKDKCKLSEAGDTIHQHYTLFLEDGTWVDSSFSSGEPFVFKLGAKAVIAGMDTAMTGMCEGERRQLTIPPALGYGVAGSPPKVPGNATLYFDIELFKLIKRDEL